ncbi:transglycosylase domain-containing protein [Enorma phocaeensis]|uniref:transglycosylase domain-containing protein n=1 Tax=Enorma phocaeensis TaxID=1871019 RepID=UPI00195627DD|nr:PBP1A family penicillin-binding protein [Enorma phocaeensis]MBM6952493.1 PBP1A family penicillin-binding protein [Enorma phocaeensis]
MGPRERHRRNVAKTHTAPIVIVSLLGFFLVAGVAFGVGMLGNVNRWLQNLPDYTDTDLYLTSEPSVVLDSAGNEIARFYTQNRTNISWDECSDYVKSGMVATEDERFYEHNGVDLIGIMRAVVVQLTGGSEGASTITQQLVRNTILSDEQFDITLERKVREAYLALKVEETYSKEEILMMYLNAIYYGHGAYGIEAASQTYFSKPASDLTLAEAALLVGLPNSPSTYDPTVNPDLALQRRNTVLDRMLSNGVITQEEHDAAQAEEIVLNVTESSGTGKDVYAYPYFVDYVLEQLQSQFSYTAIFSGGLTIQTSIDPTVQQAAEQAVTDRLNTVGLDGLEAGVTIIDNKTGQIKAMVGGRDYYADEGHTNHATSGRQVGSSFKGFTLATAINEGMNPSIPINCNSPMTFDNGVNEIHNYGNQSYGTITLARATELSSNTGYVQVAKAVGNSNIIDLCRQLGIDADIPDVTSTTLGVASISTLEMAEAYSTFATGGVHRDAAAIVSVTNRDDEVVYQQDTTGEQVLDTGVTEVVTDILSGVITRGTGSAARLSVNQPFSGKTGTTTDVADLWFCGYTPQYTIATWTGYSEGAIPIRIGGRDALGDDLTLPIVRNIMNTILDGVAREEFPTGETPTYKNNSVWQVEGKSLVGMQSATTDDAETEEPETPETVESPDSPNSPSTSPSTPDTPPASTTDPSTPATNPDPPATTDPGAGTDPGTGGGDGGGGETTTPAS